VLILYRHDSIADKQKGAEAPLSKFVSSMMA